MQDKSVDCYGKRMGKRGLVIVLGIIYRERSWIWEAENIEIPIDKV